MAAVVIAQAPTTASNPQPPAQLSAGTPNKIVAFGDSFTAGFGYYGDGSWMAATRLVSCKPKNPNNDACSSNTNTRDNDNPAGIYFSDDYGFNNQISWTANMAWSLGVRSDSVASRYRNFAVTGSTAAGWADGKVKFAQYGDKPGLDVVIDEKPDLVLMSLGGNPTLSDVLLGKGGKDCSEYKRASKEQADCFGRLIDKAGTIPALTTVYKRILTQTQAKILVMIYPQVVPAAMTNFYSAESMLNARNVLNDAVAKAIENVQAELPDAANRIRWTHKDFNVGIPPGEYINWAYCIGRSAYDVGADGKGEQSDAAGAEFFVTRNWATAGGNSGYCGYGPTYVISQDAGIHPSQDGYRAMRDGAMQTWNNWPRQALTSTGKSSNDAQMLFSTETWYTAKPGEKIKVPLRYQGAREVVTAVIKSEPNCTKRPRSKAQVKRFCTQAERVGVGGREPLLQDRDQLVLRAPQKPGDYVVRLRLRDNGPEDSVDKYLSLKVQSK